MDTTTSVATVATVASAALAARLVDCLEGAWEGYGWTYRPTDGGYEIIGPELTREDAIDVDAFVDGAVRMAQLCE